MILELHLIQNDKLKVLLTPFDMMKYELTCESLDYDNTETRKAIWSILDFAKHETGFDAALGKIRIEVYPEKSGGCAIYITKLAKNDLPSSEDMNETSEKQSSAEGKNAVVYQFDRLDDLLAVCRALEHRAYKGRCLLYFEHLPKGGTRYFIEIDEGPPVSKRSRYLRENLFIGEFARRIDGTEAHAYLAEHGTLISSAPLLFPHEKKK